MKVLITGGLGFIGLRLAKKILAEGHQPILVDSLSPQIHGDMPEPIDIPQGAKFVRMDVRDIATRPDLLEACDWVYHLAAETGTAQSMYQISRYVSVNEMGTAALLEGLAKCQQRPKKFILASSRSVYGEGAYQDPDQTDKILHPRPRTLSQLKEGHWEHLSAKGEPLIPVPSPESLSFAPGSVYAATKASQELLVEAAATALGMKSCVLRFQNVYGEGQSLQNPYTGIISIFFNRARQGMEIPLYEDGLETRDFVHVDDVVEALYMAAEADLPSGLVMNVGSGIATSVRALAETLITQSGFHPPVNVTGQFRVGDIRHCYADISRLRIELGLTPTVQLSQGLRRFCAWAAAQPVYTDKSSVANEELRQNGLTGQKSDR